MDGHYASRLEQQVQTRAEGVWLTQEHRSAAGRYSTYGHYLRPTQVNLEGLSLILLLFLRKVPPPSTSRSPYPWRYVLLGVRTPEDS